MDFIAYRQLFLDILDNPAPPAPYDDPDYINYARLNWSRQHRWLTTGILNQELATLVKNLDRELFWTVITEPWCGDAAHTVPFMHLLANLSPLIKLDFQLRDSPPFLIEHYLTNGISKSIPKLVIADKDHNDLAVWGSRPAGCQQLYDQMTKDHVPYVEKKIALQKWYNEDKGESFQKELLAILHNITSASPHIAKI